MTDERTGAEVFNSLCHCPEKLSTLDGRQISIVKWTVSAEADCGLRKYVNVTIEGFIEEEES